MATDLVNFWRALELESDRLYVHPRDSDWICQHRKGSKPLDQEPILNWDAYLRSERFGSNESQPHFSLIPVPYVGNLERAKIIICLANPGLADADYYAESQPAFKRALIANLKQEPGLQYPFVYLDPDFAWTPAYQWWVRRLKPIILELTKAGRRSYIDALTLLSKNVAVIELFPYHSRDVAEINGWNKTDPLPSVKAMREFFAGLTHSSDKLTLLMRSHALWETSGCGKPTKSYLQGKKGRSISFDPTTETGAAMLSRLENLD